MAGGYCVCLYYPASVHKVGPHNLSPIVKLINTPVYTYIVCQSTCCGCQITHGLYYRIYYIRGCWSTLRDKSSEANLVEMSQGGREVEPESRLLNPSMWSGKNGWQTRVWLDTRLTRERRQGNCYLGGKWDLSHPSWQHDNVIVYRLARQINDTTHRQQVLKNT